MDEIIIRKARREDCKTIRTLIQELANYEEMSDGPSINYETLERDGFGERPLFLCNVATYKDEIIGYTITFYTYSTWRGKAMFMDDLYVKPEFRGKQVGQRLLKANAKDAVENNCFRLDFMVLNWNSAQDFYKKLDASDITLEEKWHTYRFSDYYRRIPNRGFFYWLTVIFNRVDRDRIQAVGPDRACAEWLLRNGASVRWKGFTEHLKDYNNLPKEDTRYYVQAVDATDSGITHVGFPHFDGCRYIDEIKLVRCKYLYNTALPLLSVMKDTLITLEIRDCKPITDQGVRSLKTLKNLKTLKLIDLPYLENKNSLKKELAEALPNCVIELK